MLGVNYETFVPSYADRLLKVNNMQSYYDMKVLYMGKKEEALAQLERDDLTETERKNGRAR